MSSNRVYTYIRRILQNSKLNRENSIKNKINYNVANAKNRTVTNSNMITKRHISTSTFKQENRSKCGGNGGGKPNGYLGLIALAIGFYAATGRFNDKKK